MTKMTTKRTILSLSLVSILALSSCLKEHDTNVSTEDFSPTFVSLVFPRGNSTVNSGPQYFNSAGLQYSADAATAVETFLIKVGGAGEFNSDITATVGVDATKIADNTDGVVYELLPDSTYEITSTSVVLPAKERTAEGTITFHPNKIDPTHTYVLPVVIKDAGGTTIASNINTIYFRVALKNRYDGVYSLRMRLEEWTAYGISTGVSGPFPKAIELTTNLANTVTHFNTNFNTELQPGFTGTPGVITGSTQFGAASPEYIFDNATNKLIDVKNTIADDGRGRTFKLNPAVTDSRFDPTDKIIYAAYMMTQTGRPNLLIYDTLTYTGSR
ncbi:MAG: DUF1735 domain-containing protein [Chitinophagaceae bacterium]|nr:MAG: DUF1735 domain-containing protein [Chitinophagaceae bacterium]